MRHDFLDRYSRIESPIHRLSATFKLGVAILFVLILVATPLDTVWVYVLAASVLLLVAALSRIPWLFILKRLLMLEPLALGIALMSLFQPGGVSVFLAIAVKSTLCITVVIFLSNTTPFDQLLRVVDRLGTPRIMVTILALMYRYLFVLIDEGERLTRARVSRTFTHNKFRRWQSLANLIGQLFVRSTERAERIYAAMTARGWR